MYTIGQIAKKFHLSRTALLYYDSIELLKSSERTSSGYRLYSESDCRLLERICGYREAGMSLNNIKELLSGSQSITVSLLERRIHELNKSIEALREQQKGIVRLLLDFQVQERKALVANDAWDGIFSAAGFSLYDQWQWHREFEMMSPEQHQLFLESAGVSPGEISKIKNWAQNDFEIINNSYWGRSKNNHIFIMTLTLLLLLSGCSADVPTIPAVKQAMLVTDMFGVSVNLNNKIYRIADAWAAHQDIVCLLGGGDKIVATTMAITQKPWLQKINPDITKAAMIFSSASTNVEELIKCEPDVVFVSNSNKDVAAIRKADIPVVQLSVTDFNSLKDCVRLTAAVLGGSAIAQADKYIRYLDDKQAQITGITAQIPLQQKPRVLHIAKLNPLLIDGAGTIIDDWINMAGGVNVAAVTGNLQAVTLEQVSNWNPEVLVIAREALVGRQIIMELEKDDLWRQIAAVKTKRVYVNPRGVFSWDRYGAEEALQIQWAAKVFHPENFKDDLGPEVKWFFKEFYHYELADHEVRQIIGDESTQLIGDSS